MNTLSEERKVERVFDPKTVTEARKRFGGDFNWRLYHSMFELDDFSFDYSYAKKSIGMNEDEFQEMLEAFEVMEFISKENGRWEITNSTVTVPMDVNNISLQLENHEIFMCNLAGQLSEQQNTHYANGYVASNKQAVSELHKEVMDAVIRFNEKSASLKKDGLYGIGFTVTNLLQSVGEKQ